MLSQPSCLGRAARALSCEGLVCWSVQHRRHFVTRPSSTPPTQATLNKHFWGICLQGNVTAMHEIISQGADPNATNSRWRNFHGLHYAAQWGSSGVILALVEEYGCWVDVLDDDQCTPLFRAVKWAYPSTSLQKFASVALLLHRSAITLHPRYSDLGIEARHVLKKKSCEKKQLRGSQHLFCCLVSRPCR